MASDNQLRVTLVTPERILLDTTATSVDLPSRTGQIEVLAGHAPLVAELGAGDVTLHGAKSGADSGNGTTRWNVSWGFVEVLPNRVTILANAAVAPSAIDAAAARQQVERAHAEWSVAGDDAEAYEAANRLLDEAQARLASAEA